MNKRGLLITISVICALFLIAIYFGLFKGINTTLLLRTLASSGSVSIDSQDEWESGVLLGIDSVSNPGNIQRIASAESEINLSSLGLSNILVSANDGLKGQLIDSNTNVDNYWSGGSLDASIVFDLNEELDISRVDLFNQYNPYDPPDPEGNGGSPASGALMVEISLSTDGVNFSSLGSVGAQGGWLSATSTPPVKSRYVKFSSIYNPMAPEEIAYIGELKIFQNPASATHTSSTTQLDSGDHDTVSWTTFVPSGTIPANTSISFKFRTSPDASAWSNWSASTPYAASIGLSSLTQQRYLQVETTLGNTDGTSTPTLDSYTANYDYSDAPVSACDDGLQNGDETGVDCGGSCAACPVPPTCDDGIQNGSETGVDCGGSCGACPPDEPDPTCNDGAMNGGETGVDCGGSCGACPVEPTCIDGIQNGSETGVDCGGSCGACPVISAPTCLDGIMNGDETGVDLGGSCGEPPPQCNISECQAAASSIFEDCSHDKIMHGQSNAECISNYCSGSIRCFEACGVVDGREENTTIITPKGGESYLISDAVPVHWYYQDKHSGVRALHDDVAVVMSISLDSGASWKAVRLLIPSRDSYNALVATGRAANPDLEIGSYLIDYRTTSYRYLWTPGDPTFQSKNVRIKLEPALINCMLINNGDSSDGDFELLAANSSLRVTLSPQSVSIFPGEEATFTARAVTDDGQDVTTEATFLYTASRAATIKSFFANRVTMRAGAEIGFFERFLFVEARYQNMSANNFASLEIIFEPTASPESQQVCGQWCQAIGVIKSNVKDLLADSRRDILSVLALAIAALNLAVNATLFSKDLISPFVKGKDRKKTYGLVYDANSGRPVRKAKVMLVNLELGNLSAIALTDKDGYFSLDLSPKKHYKVQVQKDGYNIIDRSIGHLAYAELPYVNNYFGEDFSAGNDQLAFSKNIPMVEINLSLETDRIGKLNTLNRLLIAFNIPLVLFGSGITLIILRAYPTLYNYLIACLYILSLCFYLIRNYVVDGKGIGLVLNKSDGGEVVDLAIIRAFRIPDDRLLRTVLSDHQGRFSLTLPKGIYRLRAAKTNLEQAHDIFLAIRSPFRPSACSIDMCQSLITSESTLADAKAALSRVDQEENSAFLGQTPITRVFEPDSNIIPAENLSNTNSASDIIDNYQNSNRTRSDR